MENIKTSTRIHPLMAAAAVSIMLVSLAGVAAITGVLPNSYSSTTNAAMSTQAANQPSSASSSAASNNLLETEKTPQSKSDAISEDTNRNATSTKSLKAHSIAKQDVSDSKKNTHYHRDICQSCGQIESVRTISHEAKPSGLGIAAGAILGGVLGNQVGGGNGRTLATVAGAVGGGYAGNEVEKRTHTSNTYQVRVRMDDGSFRTFPYTEQPAWRAGDAVRVADGSLVSRN